MKLEEMQELIETLQVMVHAQGLAVALLLQQSPQVRQLLAHQAEQAPDRALNSRYTDQQIQQLRGYLKSLSQTTGG